MSETESEEQTAEPAAASSKRQSRSPLGPLDFDEDDDEAEAKKEEEQVAKKRKKAAAKKQRAAKNKPPAMDLRGL